MRSFLAPESEIVFSNVLCIVAARQRVRTIHRSKHGCLSSVSYVCSKLCWNPQFFILSLPFPLKHNVIIFQHAHFRLIEFRVQMKLHELTLSSLGYRSLHLKCYEVTILLQCVSFQDVSDSFIGWTSYSPVMISWFTRSCSAPSILS